MTFPKVQKHNFEKVFLKVQKVVYSEKIFLKVHIFQERLFHNTIFFYTYRKVFP